MDVFNELFGESDDEEFLGFHADEIPARPQERVADSSDEDSTSGEEPESEEDDEPQFVWTRRASPVHVPEFRPPFGPRNRPVQDTPLAFFELFFTEEVIDTIVTETNRYARQQNANRARKDAEWFDAHGNATDLTPEELKAFLGIIILMGMVKLPSLKSYWNEEEPYFYQPNIARVMTRDRFLAIVRYLHLANNEDLPPREDPEFRLFRVQRFLTEMQNNCLNSFLHNFDIKRELSIDEAMIKYKGRLSFVQYMPMKPTKRGIKVFCLCDARTGFLVSFSIYTGRVANVQAGNLVGNVVKGLVEPLRDMNFFLFMDNWFSSITLFRELQGMGFSACGTLRQNRKEFPACLKDVRLRDQGESAFAQCRDMVVVLWRDKAKNKPVTVLSTMCEARGDEVVTRRRKVGANFANVEINRPPSIGLYCRFMGGVDLSDQHRSYYTVSTRRHVKWWKYIFYFFLDIGIINAWQLQCQCLPRSLTNLQFRLQLAESLIGNYSSRRRQGRPRVQPVVANVDHCLEKMEENSRAKACKNCQRKNKRLRAGNRPVSRPRESRNGCRRCGVHLCSGDCFREWHEQWRQI